MGRRLVVCCDGTWNKPRTGTTIHRTYTRLRALLGDPADEVGRLAGSRCSRGTAPDGTTMLLPLPATGEQVRLDGQPFRIVWRSGREAGLRAA